MCDCTKFQPMDNLDFVVHLGETTPLQRFGKQIMDAMLFVLYKLILWSIFVILTVGMILMVLAFAFLFVPFMLGMDMLLLGPRTGWRHFWHGGFYNE